jgi:hypothetical protein
MSKITVNVHTKYEENYAFPDWDGNGECPQRWKYKGNHNFTISIESDIIMYSDANKILTKMLEKHSNDSVRFTYLEHDAQFHEPTELGTEEEYLELMKELETVKN